MTTSRPIWLAALLIPVVVVCGFTGAVVANAESVSQVRVAQAAYDDARVLATEAAERAAIATSTSLDLAEQAAGLVDDAALYQSLTVLDPAALAALVPRVVEVEELLAIEAPQAPELPDPVRSDQVAAYALGELALLDWASEVDRAWADHPLDQLVEASESLKRSLVEVASSVAELGPHVLLATGAAATGARAALQAAIDLVAADVAADRDAVDSVLAYSDAVRIANESHAAALWAAANAAAEAAANASYEPEVDTFSCEYWLSVIPPPILNGVPYTGERICVD